MAPRVGSELGVQSHADPADHTDWSDHAEYACREESAGSAR